MTRIPLDAIGWKVNPDTGTIHTRYATHASGFRTRTEKGVLTLLDGKKGKACLQCYGKNPPYRNDTPRPTQKRRITSWAAPAEIEVDDATTLPGS